jgi:hypothetical protein
MLETNKSKTPYSDSLQRETPEAVFLVVCDPSMNEL